MDFRDPKIQKAFIGIAAFLVVAYFWYAKVYTGYDQRLTQMTQEYSTMITNLKNVEMKAKSLEALKLEYEELLSRYYEIETLLPEVKQIPSFLVQLHTASSLTGTRITRIEPQPIETESFYNVANFEIEMSGGYHDFGTFLGYVANFPFIANVSGLEVLGTKVAAGPNFAEEKEADKFGEQKKKTVKATFTISTYFVQTNERLEELVI